MKQYSVPWRIVACGLVSLSLLTLWPTSIQLIQSETVIKEEGGAYLLIGMTENQFGWALLTLLVVLLVIVWIPFRKGQVWAWLTLWLFLFLYVIPGMIYPARFEVTHSLMREVALYFAPMAVGLIIPFLDFRRRSSPRSNDPSQT